MQCLNIIFNPLRGWGYLILFPPVPQATPGVINPSDDG